MYFGSHVPDVASFIDTILGCCCLRPAATVVPTTPQVMQLIKSAPPGLVRFVRLVWATDWCEDCDCVGVRCGEGYRSVWLCALELLCKRSVRKGSNVVNNNNNNKQETKLETSILHGMER
mgnify:CR=1 FL=1